MNWSRVLALLLVTWSLTTAQIPKPSSTSPPSAAEQQTGRENDQDIIKINTNLVQIDAVVTKSGKQVTDLTASDFEISEDGKPQSITSFTYVSSVASPTQRKSQSNDPIVPVPLQLHSGETRRTIAIVIDDLGMTAQAVYRARNQLRKFVNEQLNDTDLVAILRTSGEIGALQQFVTDRRVLLSAIDHVKWQPCSRAGADVFDYNDRPCSASSYGANLRALRYIISGMASLPDRKSLSLLSVNVPVNRQEKSLSTEMPPLPSP